MGLGQPIACGISEGKRRNASERHIYVDAAARADFLVRNSKSHRRPLVPDHGQGIGKIKARIVQIHIAIKVVARHSGDVVGEACLHGSGVESECWCVADGDDAAFRVISISV